MRILSNLLFSVAIVFSMLCAPDSWAECGPIHNWAFEEAFFGAGFNPHEGYVLNNPGASNGMVSASSPGTSLVASYSFRSWSAINLIIKSFENGGSASTEFATWAVPNEFFSEEMYEWIGAGTFGYVYPGNHEEGLVETATMGAVYMGCTIKIVDVGLTDLEPRSEIVQFFNQLLAHAKTLIDRKCGVSAPDRIVPFEADIPAGSTQVFTVVDDQNNPVDKAGIAWKVLRQKSISPFIDPGQTNIGAVDSQGVFTATGIGSCIVRATMTDGSFLDADVTVRCPDGQGDLNKVKALFQQRIVQGLIHADPQEGWLDFLFDEMNPGFATNLYANNDPRYANFTCGAYQGDVLQMLHQVQSDPGECSILNGLEFGPIQGSYGGHHAVVIYPSGSDWKSKGTVFDPWYHQKPESFSIDVWKQVFSPVSGDTSPTYRLEYPTTQDPEDHNYDVWGAAEAFVTDIARVSGIVNCPVDVLFTDGNGRRSGVNSEGQFLFEIPGTFFMRLPDGEGGYEWYFQFNGEIPSYRLAINAVADGEFDILTTSARSEMTYRYDSQPISKGQSAHMDISDNRPGPDLMLPDGTAIAPEPLALPDPCRLVDSDLDILIPRLVLQGSYFSVTLKYSHDLLWEPDLDSLTVVGSGKGILLEEDLSMLFPCAEFQGVRFSVRMIYDHGIYWSPDLESIQLK
jgi:hypothetical protein